jgi:uncharacterized protein
MKFVNRHEEMARLERVLQSKESELIVLWGRRRMGKTRLLLEWAGRNGGIYYTADESAPPLQRKYFALALEQKLPGFAAVEYSDWRGLFLRLAKESLHAGWRGPLIIDELPYLIKTSPELPTLLQKFIDHEAKSARMLIALSGSSQNMMQGAILNASAPLFGRASEMLKLGPIPLGYMEEALEIGNPREIIATYAVWGGVPRYWELIKYNGKSLLETIDDLILNPLGVLNEEANRLLLEESAMTLRPILDAIGLGAHRLSEVATRIGQPISSFTRMIQRLLELDLIERELPFGADEKNSKRTLYKIKDPFLRFWFKIVAPQRSFFVQAPARERIKKLRELLPPVISLAWEEICRNAVALLPWDKITFNQAHRYWHGSGPEWDILATSTEGNALFVGEAKWSAKPPSTHWVHSALDELKSKGLPPIISQDPRPKIYYGLFLPEKPKKLDLPPNTKIFDAGELISLFR